MPNIYSGKLLVTTSHLAKYKDHSRILRLLNIVSIKIKILIREYIGVENPTRFIFLNKEVINNMILLGTTKVKDITRDHFRKV